MLKIFNEIPKIQCLYKRKFKQTKNSFSIFFPHDFTIDRTIDLTRHNRNNKRKIIKIDKNINFKAKHSTKSKILNACTKKKIYFFHKIKMFTMNYTSRRSLWWRTPTRYQIILQKGRKERRNLGLTRQVQTEIFNSTRP